MKPDQIIAETDKWQAGHISPPPFPVLLRVPRIEEESERPVAISSPRPRYRWRVGIGAALLMLIVSLPWLIRWRPRAETPTVIGTPVISIEENVEHLPPLRPETKTAASLAFEADENVATSESSAMVTAESEPGEFWVAPNPSRGTP